MSLRLIMLGDIVGQPGRRVVHQQLPEVHRRYSPDLIIANAENVAGGSGITPQLYQKLIRYGIDGLTLGDHVYKRKEITATLDEVDRMIRPANLPAKAAGKGVMTLTVPEDRAAAGASLTVITLLGRMFMPMSADDPFATIDRILESLGDDHGPVLLELHAEATGEKIALARYVDGRVAAVVGTHTHIATADASLLPRGTAYITDLGMCGPYDSVIGRRSDRILEHMTTSMPAPFDVAEGDPRLCGVFIELDDTGRATQIERIEIKAELDRPPFAEA